MTSLRLLSSALCGAALLLGACSSVPTEPFSMADLEPARQAAAAEDWDEVWSLVDSMEKQYFDRLAQVEYSRLAGDASYHRGDWAEAIRQYEDYLRLQGPAEESRVVEARLFELGLNLLEGRSKVFWIFSDRSRGASVLINLATLAPGGDYSAEALARVGEYHFADEDWAEAIDDYQLILRYHANSEWADLATFRIGQAGYLSLDGHWVDPRLAQRSLNQLREYLRRYPSGLYRVEAQATVSALEENMARYHLEVGDYYEDIGNVRGARFHYRRAAEVSGTKAAQEASTRLAELPPDPPIAPLGDAPIEGPASATGSEEN